MLQEVTLENELNQIVYSTVKKGSFSPQPLISDLAIRNQIYDLKAEKVKRPSTKADYFALLDSLNAQILEIDNQNAVIRSQNEAGQKVVDDKYEADIAAAKLDEVNIGQALCNCINYQLNNTEWYVLNDSGLVASQQKQAEDWRTAQMNIVSEPTIDSAVTTYNNLLDTKPKYDLQWISKTQTPVLKVTESVGATPGATPGWEIK